MKVHEKFERLHPDLIQSYRLTGKSDAIPEDVKAFINILDSIPELNRIFPSVNQCARELVKKYTSLNLAFRTAQEYVYYAINYFYLNSTVKNEAWDNYYADKMMELAKIALSNNSIYEARLCLVSAHKMRFNRNENSIDMEKLRPIIHIISSEVKPKMLGLPDNINLKSLWVERKKKYEEAIDFIDKLDINQENKDQLIEEARLNMNIDEAEILTDTNE